MSLSAWWTRFQNRRAASKVRRNFAKLHHSSSKPTALSETNVMAVHRGDTSVGTSKRGHISATYAELVKLFGPQSNNGDGYQTSTEWNLVYDGKPFTVYDWYATLLYDDKLPSVAAFRASSKPYTWHVGGPSEASTKEFLGVVRVALNRLRGNKRHGRYGGGQLRPSNHTHHGRYGR